MKMEYLFLKEMLDKNDGGLPTGERNDEEEVQEEEAEIDLADPRVKEPEYETRFWRDAERAAEAAQMLQMDIRAASDGMFGWIELTGAELNLDRDCDDEAVRTLYKLGERAAWCRIFPVQRYGRGFFCIKLGVELYSRVSHAWL